MQRALRRHQQRVAKARRTRILLTHGVLILRRHGRQDWSAWQPKIWHSIERLVMNEPGWWTHLRVIQPARTQTHRLEHDIWRGCHADALLWPDCKKPHDYYW